jgi:hypothetical protein
MAAPPAPVAAPAARKTSPLVWILVIIVGLFVLGFIGVVGTGMFIVHKAKQAGFDSELMQRNPAYAAAKMIVALNPDLSEVRHNDSAGTITVLDKKTGKEMTMSFDDIKNGKLKFTAEGDDGKVATMEIGGAGKLPSWVPEYPGATAQPSFSVKGNSGDGSGEGGNVTFTVKDAPSKVLAFYQDKTKEMGMKANMSTNTPDGGMFIAGDEDGSRSLTVVVGTSNAETTVNLTYGRKR